MNEIAASRGSAPRNDDKRESPNYILLYCHGFRKIQFINIVAIDTISEFAIMIIEKSSKTLLFFGTRGFVILTR